MLDYKCPNCQSTEIEGESVEVSGDRQATQNVFCSECSYEWTNVYALISQIEIEP
jgi:DNA-directed RNA polymerase subunit M/transcription elongation factor TFIIS